MLKDQWRELNSSKATFLSCEKDLSTILEKLFITGGEASAQLKRLLLINENDCLDNQCQEYKDLISNATIGSMKEQGYIKIVPPSTQQDHEPYKNFIYIGFTNFSESMNPEYRDGVLKIDIVCPHLLWDLGNCRLRPIKIMGCVDGLLKDIELSNIGHLNFIGAPRLYINEEISGYTLAYDIIHDSDDTYE